MALVPYFPCQQTGVSIDLLAVNIMDFSVASVWYLPERPTCSALCCDLATNLTFGHVWTTELQPGAPSMLYNEPVVGP